VNPDTVTIQLKVAWADRAARFLRAVSQQTLITMRGFLSVLGISIWAIRALRLPLSLIGDLIDLGVVIDWEDTLTVQSQSISLSADSRHSIHTLSQIVTKRRYVSCRVTRRATFAYIDARPVRMAVVEWPSINLDEPEHYRRNPVESAINATQPASTSCTVHAQDFARPINNNVAELLAFLKLVQVATPQQSLAVASDSMVSLGWVKRGWARAPEIRAIILRIWITATVKHLRLLSTWVSDPDNLSDPFTREDRRTGPVKLQWVRPAARPFEVTVWV